MAHDAISGEPVCWSYLTTRCGDAAAAEKLLAEHGRTAHRLHEQWRVELKRTAASGQKPPAPTTRQGTGLGATKRRSAAAADKERGDKERGDKERGSSDDDSSEGERPAAPIAAPAGAAKGLVEVEPAGTSGAEAAASAPLAARPSFLAV